MALNFILRLCKNIMILIIGMFTVVACAVIGGMAFEYLFHNSLMTVVGVMFGVIVLGAIYYTIDE